MKVVKLDSLAADLDAERDGEWISVQEWPGVRFRCLSTESADYKNAHQALMKKFARKYDDRLVPDEEWAEAMGQLFAEHLLLEWDGLDVPYSKEAALDALTSLKHRKLRTAVFNCAARVGQRNVEFVELAIKNSEPPSATI